MWSRMWEALALSPLEAVEVVLSAIGIYFGFLILIRFLGQRSLASLSTFDFAAILSLGAVAGRAILGYTPTLGAGIIAFVTLFALQSTVGQLRRTPFGANLVRNRPVLLMAGDEILHENLLKTHIVEDELWAVLRRAGIRNTGEVAFVVLESTGSLSVLRRGEPLDRAMLAGVKGAELVPDAAFR